MILVGDVIEKLSEIPRETVQTCVTSPPYWGLRDYGVEGQLGLEKTPQEFVANMVEVFRGVRRVLRDDGTLWLNIGDSYAQSEIRNRNGNTKYLDRPDFAAGTNQSGRKLNHGLKPKDLCLIPERLAIALQDDGWWIRSRIAWCKKSSMPESVTDRPTSAWEHIWLLTKSARYYYDAEAVKVEASSGTDLGLLRGRSKTTDKGVSQAAPSIKARQDAGVNSRTAGTGSANLRNYWILGPEPFSGAKLQTAVSPDRVGVDDAADGAERITSQDCPVHGDSPVLPTKAQCDGRVGESPNRTPRTGAGPDLTQLFDSAPPEKPPVSETQPDNSDCLDPSCSPSATDHSKGNHKTALASGSSPSCNSSAGSPDHIEHTSTSPSVPPRIKCTCKYIQENPKNNAHFATFPSEIPRRCIKAGTSQKGACSECGAPWERITEKVIGVSKDCPKTMASHLARGGTEKKTGTVGQSGSGRTDGYSTTTGWQPTCDHDAPTEPCRVLDPFLGSGTTAAVAQELDREWVGIELNPEYAALAEKRIASVGAPQIGLSI